MEDLSILLQSVIAIAFPIALWLFARAAPIPLIKRQYKWLGAREVTPEEREAAFEAYNIMTHKNSNNLGIE